MYSFSLFNFISTQVKHFNMKIIAFSWWNCSIQVEIGICKDIGNFTSALESLELETTNHPGFRTNYMQTDYFNDSEQEETVPVFKTRERSTFELVVQGPEILIFQVWTSLFIHNLSIIWSFRKQIDFSKLSM